MPRKKTPSGQLFEIEIMKLERAPRAKKEKKAKQERSGMCSDCRKSFPVSELHVPKHQPKMVCPACYMTYVSQVTNKDE